MRKQLATKRCSRCRIEKPRDGNFHRDKSTPSGWRYWCNTCAHAYNRRQQPRAKYSLPINTSDAEVDAARISRREFRKKHITVRKFGLTLGQLEIMNKKQKGLCAICGGPPNGAGAKNGRLHVDHDHKSGKIRALLCGNCNHGLGKFQDDPVLLNKAARYLRLWEKRPQAFEN